MSKRPTEVKLTTHARGRLEERKDNKYTYNTTNLMKSNCKWYHQNDFTKDSAIYRHSMYACRKSPHLKYMTNGEIEVVYNGATGVALTVMEVKEKFLPIDQHFNSNTVHKIKSKKEKKEMRKAKEMTIGNCPDCGENEIEITSQGVCVRCRTRLTNAKSRKQVYVPYIELSQEEKDRIDRFRKQNAKEDKPKEEIKEDKIFVDEKVVKKSIEQMIKREEEIVKPKPIIDDSTFNDREFTNILRECGCEIVEKELQDVLRVLTATNQLKDLCTTISTGASQQALLDLDQMLNVTERKLQHNWEYNGFNLEDDRKFKYFLMGRRSLKEAIFFWKKLYSTSTLLELQKLLSRYESDPNDRPTLFGEQTSSALKRYQITTVSISSIYNTKKPFTRIFYAMSQEAAYDQFIKWMTERQLHEDKSKTTIVELTNTGVKVNG